jgi:glutathione S-transferase
MLVTEHLEEYASCPLNVRLVYTNKDLSSARMLLNYKGLEYKTTWVEYPDVQRLLETKYVSQLESCRYYLTSKTRVPKSEAGIAYTCPTIMLNYDEWITGSRKIAERLDKLYPDNSLAITSPSALEIEALTDKIVGMISPDFIPKVPKRLLGSGSIPFWYQTRQEWFDGMALDEVEQRKGGAHVYEAARPLLERVLVLLKQNPKGSYFEGDRSTYADIVWVGLLRFYEMLGNDCLAQLIILDAKAHRALLNACRPWLERDDR